MQKKIILRALLCATLGMHLHAQGASLPISFHAYPGVMIPLGEGSALFTVAPDVELTAAFRLPPLPLFFLHGGVGYQFDPIQGAAQSLSVLNAFGGFGLQGDFGAVGLSASASLGYYYAVMHNVSQFTGGGCPSITMGLGADYFLSPEFGLGIRGSFRYLMGLSMGVTVCLGVTYDLGGAAARSKMMQAPAPRPSTLEVEGEKGSNEGLQIKSPTWGTIFPVFRTYYDDHPIGTLTLANLENEPITEISLTLQMKQYMDSPKECSVPHSLKAGESSSIELNALFSDRILDVTEGTKAPVELVLRYKLQGKWYRSTRIDTLMIQNRNAMTWDDDRRAAAFVTSFDPPIQTLASNIISATNTGRSRSVDTNLLSAMAIYEAMRLYGLSYLVDPSSAYAEMSQNKGQIDYLKYPRQTLEHKAGDCDDLSILFCALFQSVSVPAAFLTVPGHIFAAIALDTPVDVVKKSFSRAADLIFLDGKAWLPLELTDRTAGFLKAWELGANLWRKYSVREQARLSSMEAAWKAFPPVQLPGSTARVAFSSEDRLARAFLEEMVRYIDGEIFERIAQLQGEMKKSGETPRLVNKMGALYAQFGLLDRAEREFTKLLSSDYVPALVNLGNIYYLRDNTDKALELYSQAAAKDPDNPTVLLCLARANHKQENYGAAARAFDKLKQIKPDLASRYAYLNLRDAGTNRAADVSKAREAVEWAQED